MIVAARVILVALAWLTRAAGATAAAGGSTDNNHQIAQLIELHDLTTSESIGNFYLKRESLIAIRGLIAPLGKKYFVTAILKLTGVISRRLDEFAVVLPKAGNARADPVRPLLQEFKSGHA